MKEPIRIADPGAPELQYYREQNENRLRRAFEPAEGLFVCETVRVIGRAMEAGYAPESFLVTEEAWAARTEAASESIGGSPEHTDAAEESLGALVRAAAPDVPLYVCPEPVMRAVSGSKLPGGVLSLMRRRPLPAVAELCRGARRVVWLEDVENPTNVGAIFRSAAAIGMDAVVLTKACADPLYRRAARVSMGNVFQVPWTFTALTGPAERSDPRGRKALAALKEQGFVIAALALEEGALPIDAPELKAAAENAAGLMIVLGNEAEGISAETLAVCDYTAVIPMKNGVDSLNVAAASAVAFWELRSR